MNENLSMGRRIEIAVPARCQDGADNKPVVVALHCSGADGSQWRKLAAALAPNFTVVAPDFIGAKESAPWHGRRAFRLADEADHVLSFIERCKKPVHLVGHSYGSSVALRMATSSPSRIASLSLYEPSAFHLLRELGPDAVTELAEIERLAQSVVHGLASGACAEAAEKFVDYWNGDGAWSALRDDVRTSMLQWMPYAALHFHALLSEITPLAGIRLHCPGSRHARRACAPAKPPSRRGYRLRLVRQTRRMHFRRRPHGPDHPRRRRQRSHCGAPRGSGSSIDQK